MQTTNKLLLLFLPLLHLRKVKKVGGVLLLLRWKSPPENQLLGGIDSHMESILWNRCLGLLKSLKIRAQDFRVDYEIS
jgi:hypothetical protein